MERAASLVAPQGGYAMIVPISFQFSKNYASAREVITQLFPQRWVSCYTIRPSSLFGSGISVRSTILFGHKDLGKKEVLPFLATTETRRWFRDNRTYLFDTNQYVSIQLENSKESWPRIGHPSVRDLYEKLTSNSDLIVNAIRKTGPAVRHKKTAGYYLSVYIDSPPAWKENGQSINQIEGKLKFESEEVRDIAFMLLSGRLAYWWWMVNGDDFNVTGGILKSFPIAPKQVEKIQVQLLELAKQLRLRQPQHPSVTLYAGKEIGNYDLNECRHITDQADQLVLDTLGISHLWPAVLLADARAQKVTNEGTEREWPFPWEWQGQQVQPDHWL